MTRQDQLVPQIDEVVDSDESAYIVVVALTQHLLVHPSPVPPVSHVEHARWATPTNVERQLDDSDDLLDVGCLDVVGNGRRLRGGPGNSVHPHRVLVPHALGASKRGR